MLQMCLLKIDITMTNITQQLNYKSLKMNKLKKKQEAFLCQFSKK
jgi:hypothetical protein